MTFANLLRNWITKNSPENLGTIKEKAVAR
jgi:hypothetical protein